MVTPRQAIEMAETREKILGAARELFVAQGVEAVSLRKVAESIGYTAPAIYTHFADKQALLQEMCRQDFGRLAAVFNQVAMVAHPAERIFRIGMTYIRFAVEHPNHYRLMFMTPRLAELVPPTEEDLAAMEDPNRDAYAFLLKTVEEGLGQNLFRADLTDAELLAQTLWAGVHGVASMQITHGSCPVADWRPLEARARTMCESVLRGLMRDPSVSMENWS